MFVQFGSAIAQRRTSASSAAAQTRRQSSITGRLPADLTRMRGPETGTGGNPFARSRSRSAVSGGSRPRPRQPRSWQCLGMGLLELLEDGGAEPIGGRPVGPLGYGDEATFAALIELHVAVGADDGFAWQRDPYAPVGVPMQPAIAQDEAGAELEVEECQQGVPRRLSLLQARTDIITPSRRAGTAPGRVERWSRRGGSISRR